MKIAISETLSKAFLLISTESKWCRGSRARNKVGKEVAVMSKSAVSFCSKGALLRTIKDESADIATLEKYFSAKGNGGNPLGLNYIGVNELKPYSQVVQMWTEAIRLAKVEEALGDTASEKKEAFNKLFKRSPT